MIPSTPETAHESSLMAAAARIDRAVTRLSLGLEAVLIPLLVLLPIANLVGRALRLQATSETPEMAMAAFFAAVMVSLGVTYLRDGHVRVDILHERFSPRARIVLELAAIALILVPFSVAMIAFGAEITWRAFADREALSYVSDLHIAWVLRAPLPIGFVLVLASAAARLLRCIAALQAFAAARRSSKTPAA